MADRIWRTEPSRMSWGSAHLVLSFVALNPLGYGQQPDLETIEEVCLGNFNQTTATCESAPDLLKNPAQQGLAAWGGRFVTSRGVCVTHPYVLKTHLFQYDADWVQTDEEPIDAGPHCHVGDITLHDGSVWAPLSNFRPEFFPGIPPEPGADMFQIARFNPDTLREEAKWNVGSTLNHGMPGGLNGDLAGLGSYNGDLWAVEWRPSSAAQNAHIFQLATQGLRPPTLVQTYEISTRYANGIEFDPPFIYIAQGDRDDFGFIDVYDLSLSTSTVNTPRQSLSYDVSGSLVASPQGTHAEGLTLRSGELWVCAGAGDVVRQIQRPAGRIWYVDSNASGANDGRTWSDAFIDLQGALDAATSGDEIWVAKGAGPYVPSKESNPGEVRSATFALVAGVSLYGGFKGVEQRRAEIATDSCSGLERTRDVRCPEANETILSGDLGGQRVYHVVSAACQAGDEDCIDSTAVIDGFTLRDGLANGSGGGQGRGAGMYINRASPTVRNCKITANDADVGAGMGLVNGSRPTLHGCDFIDNEAEYEGGAMNIGRSAPRVVNCKFLGNSGGDEGGGIHFENQSDSGQSAEVYGCVFSGNSTTDHGGGLYARGILSAPDVLVTNCTFSRNQANREAGGLGVEAGTVTVENSIFWGNEDSSGGGEAAQVRERAGGTADVRYSTIQDSDASDASIPFGGAANNNIDDDPKFIDPVGRDAVAGTEDDNLRISFTSPCADQGNNADVPGVLESDIDGKPRLQPQDPISSTTEDVDMGAFEYAYNFTWVTHGNTLNIDSDTDFANCADPAFNTCVGAACDALDEACRLFSEENEDATPPEWVVDMADTINDRASFANARPFGWNARSGNWGSGWVIAAGQHLAAIVYTAMVEHDLQHVHLIGHSRGSGVVSEAIRRLGAIGVGDHMGGNGRTVHKTMLDPVDSTNHGFCTDPENGCPNIRCADYNTDLESIQNLDDPIIRVYENETRSDAYHRDPCDCDTSPRGTPISAAANKFLSDGVVTHTTPRDPFYCGTILGTQQSTVCSATMTTNDGYYWSIGGGGWSNNALDCRIDTNECCWKDPTECCRKDNPQCCGEDAAPCCREDSAQCCEPAANDCKTPVPAPSDVDWIPNGNFEEKPPNWYVADSRVWTGYRWEEPTCPAQWRYVNGVRNGVSFGSRVGATDNAVAVFQSTGGTLIHQPILIPPSAKTLRYELRVASAPGPADVLRVAFAGEQIESVKISQHDTGCFEDICVDIQSDAGRMGELTFDYSGGASGIDGIDIDNIAISFDDCPPPGIPERDIFINEIWADDPGEDEVEYIEIAAPSGTSLEDVSLLVLDGDTDGDPISDNFRRVTERVDFDPCLVLVHPVDPIAQWVIGTLPGANQPFPEPFPMGTLEDGSQTYALVRTSDVEIDEDDQLTQLSADAIGENLIDAVATLDDAADHAYFGAPVVQHEGTAADFMQRFPDAEDTDSPADWETLSGVEFGAPGDPSTPGAPNESVATQTSLFLRGDCNDDGTVDISDAVFTLGNLFLGAGDRTCDDACDSNDDGTVDISDPIATLGVLFLGQGVIPRPGMDDCGVDPTDDALDCLSLACPRT